MRYNWSSRNLELSDNYEANFLELEGEDYYLEPLDDTFKRSKGGNSCVFRLVSAPDSDISFAIKFCRSPVESMDRNDKHRAERFKREVEALRKCKNSQFNQCVVEILQDGRFKVGQDATLLFYVMEEVDYDLKKYLEENELSDPERLALCKKILDALQGLHELGIYHRDIKPDNIFLINNQCKIGDLGLINYRDRDLRLDKFRDRIGPFGFYSPEAINFALQLRANDDGGFFQRIDEKSDVFQLGLVFWYIFQQQVPSGQLNIADLSAGQHSTLFENIMLRMLQYCKRRRCSSTEVQGQIIPLMRDWGFL